jgi:hypothetical protein
MVNSEGTLCRSRILGYILMHFVPLFDAAMLRSRHQPQPPAGGPADVEI